MHLISPKTSTAVASYSGEIYLQHFFPTSIHSLLCTTLEKQYTPWGQMVYSSYLNVPAEPPLLFFCMHIAFFSAKYLIVPLFTKLTAKETFPYNEHEIFLPPLQVNVCQSRCRRIHVQCQMKTRESTERASFVKESSSYVPLCLLLTHNRKLAVSYKRSSPTIGISGEFSQAHKKRKSKCWSHSSHNVPVLHLPPPVGHGKKVSSTTLTFTP